MKALSLRILQGEYAISRLPPDADVPRIDDAPFWSITRTAAELSVVAPVERAPHGGAVESGWSCLEVEGPLAFALTGVLAALSEPLAAAAVSIFVVSTFDTDYVLVRTADLGRAVEALRAAEHTITD